MVTGAANSTSDLERDGQPRDGAEAQPFAAHRESGEPAVILKLWKGKGGLFYEDVCIASADGGEWAGPIEPPSGEGG